MGHINDYSCFIGDIGENMYFNYCLYNNINCKKATIEQQQLQDIDFIITTNDGVQHGVEIKTDTKINETGNIFIETQNKHTKIKGKEGLGWIYFTHSEKIWFYNPIGKIAYGFYTKVLQEYIQQNAGCLRVVHSKDKYGNYDGGIGLLVSLNKAPYFATISPAKNRQIA